MQESGAARPHPGAPSSQPKASSEPEALPGSPLCPQLPKAREGPRTGQPQTDWPQQRVPRGPLPAPAGSCQRPQGRRQCLVSTAQRLQRGQPAQRWGRLGSALQRGLCGIWSQELGALSRASTPHSPSGDIRTPGGVCLVLFQRRPLARRCSPLGQLGSFPGHFRSDLLSPGLHGAGQRHSHRHPCGAGQTTLSAVSW